MGQYISPGLLDVYLIKQERDARIAAIQEAREERKRLGINLHSTQRSSATHSTTHRTREKYEREPQGPDPTEEEIAAATAEIRKTWTAQEYMRRAQYGLHRPNETGYCTPFYLEATIIQDMTHPLTQEERDVLNRQQGLPENSLLSKESGHATEVRLVEENDCSEHQDGDTCRQALEAGHCDCDVEGGQEQAC